jgi:SCY1-like protein 2
LGITKDVMATKVIPFLMPLCIENGLSLSQFNAILAVVKDMIGRVESEHRTKLEQLNSIQKESKYDTSSISRIVETNLFFVELLISTCSRPRDR